MRRVRAMPSARVIGPLTELRNGYRAVVAIDGLTGWRVLVETQHSARGGRIVRLELRATSADSVLTASQLLRIKPPDVLAAVYDDWLLSTGPAEHTSAPRHGEPITDEYLAELSIAALSAQGTVKS